MSNIYSNIAKSVKDAETVAKAFGIKPFPIYFLGGSGCILGNFTLRATNDFDFVDLNYAAELGKVFAIFKDYDMLEYESSTLSPSYKDRAIRLNEFKYFEVYVLSKEDIIVSKIIRMAQKDIEDINILIETTDKNVINKIIDEVINREDLYDTKKLEFLNKLSLFREKYNV